MVYNFRPWDSLDLVVFRITSEMFLHHDQRPTAVVKKVFFCYEKNASFCGVILATVPRKLASRKDWRAIIAG